MIALDEFFDASRYWMENHAYELIFYADILSTGVSDVCTELAHLKVAHPQKSSEEIIAMFKAEFSIEVTA